MSAHSSPSGNALKRGNCHFESNTDDTLASKAPISPPPLKRARRTSPTSNLAPTLPSRSMTLLQESQLRVMTWNVNGIQPFLQPSIDSFFKSHPKPRHSTESYPSPSLRACLERWRWPQVVCLQEVKIAPHDHQSQKSVRRLVKAPDGSSMPSYEAFFSLPRDKYNARGFGGKVYGVCTLVRGDLLETQGLPGKTVTADPVDWDMEGRVLALRLHKSRLLVLNVYAVNGTDNPYKDPETGKVSGTRHDFKRAFHSRLRDMVAGHEEEGWKVMIAGDLNIARSPLDGYPGIRLGASHVENRRDFEDKFMKPVDDGGLGMVDSFRYLHGEERKYSYRSPNVPWGSSCDRVDLILVSRGMVREPRTLLEADILDEEVERGRSDHLPCYVTVRVN